MVALYSKTVNPPGCPSSWKVYENNCYKLFFKEESVTRNEASRACSGYASKLAWIHSSNEQDFITNYRAESVANIGYLWLGGNGKRGLEKTAKWTWDDGTEFNFTNWRAGEEAATDGNCMYLHSDNKWYDARCGPNGSTWNIRRYICKKPGKFWKFRK